MPAASTSINRYSSYTPSSQYYTSYGGTGSSYGGGSSYANRTTSLDRASYGSKTIPSVKSTPSSSYLNGNYSSRYTSALPPRPSYGSESYRSSRNLRTSPTKHSRISEPTGGLSDITRECRYTVGRYRESSISRDSGYGSRYSSNERSTDSDYFKRRHSVERRRDSLNYDEKPRVSDRIRSYELKTDPIEERLAQRRRRLGLSPTKDVLSNRHSRFSEQNGNDSSYRYSKSNPSTINNNSFSTKYQDTNGYTPSRSNARESKFTSSVRKRTDSSNSEDSKSSDASSSFRPHSPIVRNSAYSASAESILASIRDNKLSSSKPPSPPPQPPVKEYSTSSRLKRDGKKKLSSTVQERVAARLNSDGEEGPLRKRNPTCSSTGSFNESSTGLVGLRNIGNTCFMNSILQCLSNTPCLRDFVVQEGYSSEINTTLSTMKGDLVRSFAHLICDLWSGSDDAVNTGTFKSQIQRFAPVFNGYAQHDAQEFLRKLLEGLHEDVNRVTVRPKPITEDIDDSMGDNQIAMESWKRYLRYDDSKIVDMFVGQLKSSLQCSVCSHRSVTFDPFWDLSLPMPNRAEHSQVELSQCLDLFTKEEVLDNDERPTCSRCKERRKMTKTFSIHKFPKVLVIHLKRFSPTERWKGKLSYNVEFPLEGLDLMRYASTSSAPCRYNLIGVANHSGTTFNGHYIAYCKHPHQGTWHQYNDTKVSSMSPNRVCGPEAYVLFYELANS